MGNKTIITIGLWLFSHLIMSGQGIPIQLMIVDSDGFEKVNHNVKLRLTMSNDTSSTAGQYQEVHITQSNEFGIISVAMGSGISTTNRQVLGISQFTFSASEPFIKVELDTSQSLNQYYEVGYVPYSYPMIARRAFKADSADFSTQSENSAYTDTAEYARNFDESYDGDTNSQNEIQSLSFDTQNQILSLSNSNHVKIQGNDKTQSESIITEFQDPLGGYWIVADSIYFYGITNGTTLIKSLISRPDSIVSSINVGFDIECIFPSDSIIIGSSPGSSDLKINICDLNGNNQAWKSVSRNSGYDNIKLTWSSVNNHKISFFIDRYSGYDELYTWDLNTSNLNVLNMPGYGVGYSNDHIFEKFYSSSGFNGQGSGWYFRFRDRWDLTTFSPGLRESQNVPKAIDSSGQKTIYRFGTTNPYYYDKRDSLNNSGYFTLYSNSSPSFIEGYSGHYLINAYDGNSYPKSQKLFLANLNNIGTNSPVLNLVFEDWSISHPEASGNFYAVKGVNEFFLFFNNVQNLWLKGSYKTGNFIVLVPYAQ